VDVFIPGCPPRPEAIVDGIIQLLTHLKEGNLPPSQMKKITEKVPA
jgi:NADH:ubiquinone oxidoreductase subunit B-like Fe-S oxidoreductase